MFTRLKKCEISQIVCAQLFVMGPKGLVEP